MDKQAIERIREAVPIRQQTQRIPFKEPQGRSPSREALNRYASIILSWIATLDPDWAERIKITKTEYHFDDLQTLGCYVGNHLARGEHMMLAPHPFFEPGADPALSSSVGVCRECGKTFTPEYGGQVLCSNVCGTAYYKKLDEAAG